MTGAGRRASHAVAGCLALAGLVAAVGHLGWLGDLDGGGAGPLLARVASAAVVGLGGAWPFLLRWTPVEPSPVKLPLFAALLSPLVVAGLVSLAVPGLGPERGVATVCGALGLAQLLALGRPLATHAPGRAAASALGLGAALAAVVGVLLLGLGNAPLTMHDGAAWNVAVAARQAAGPGLEDPFLAGAPLVGHPGFAWLVARSAQALALDPSVTAAALVVWAAAWLPVALYLWSAVVGRSGWADVTAVALFLVGWNAQGAWAGLGDGAGWAPSLAQGVPGSEPGEVWYGFALWFRGGAAAVGATTLCGAWTAAAHALRHGRRPWLGLCALLHGATLVLSPVLGLAGLAGTLVTALIAPVGDGDGAGVRGRLVPAMLACGLPGMYLGVRFGLVDAPDRLLRPALGAGNLRAAAPLLALAALGGLGALLARGDGISGGGSESEGGTRAPFDRGRRTVAVSAAAAGLALVAVALSPLGTLEGAAALRLAAAPLALLAMLGLGRAARRHAALRAVGVLAVGLVLAAGTWTTVRAVGVHRHELARASVRLRSEGRRLALAPGGDALEAARAEALAGVARWSAGRRAEGRGPGAVPVLVARTDHPRERFGPGAGHSLHGAVSGCALFLDLASGEDAARGATTDARAVRTATYVDLFAGRPTDESRLARALRLPGRPTLVLVDERDRSAWAPQAPRGTPRGIDPLLERMGARLLVDAGDAAVYLLDLEDPR